MERFAVTLVAGMLFAGSAQASSLVTLDAMERPVGPSMVEIGATTDSPSVTGMMGESRTVGEEKVAATGEDENARDAAHFAPMVIRGGLVGNAFASKVVAASAAQPESETASAETPRASEPAPASNMPEPSAPR